MSVNHHGAFPASDGPRTTKAMADLLKAFNQQAQGKLPRKYPHGRIDGDDDGQLIYKVGSDPDKGVVLLDFGKPVTWLGLEPQDAMNLAQMLIKHARAIAKTPISIELH